MAISDTSKRILHEALADPGILSAIEEVCEWQRDYYTHITVQATQNPNARFDEILRNGTRAEVWREVLGILKSEANY